MPKMLYMLKKISLKKMDLKQESWKQSLERWVAMKQKVMQQVY